MFRSALLVAVAAWSAVASAQNYSTSGPLTIDPNTVPSVQRQAWCRAQTNSCPMICGGRAQPNTCDPNTLQYNCTCSGGSTPNITDYDQTLPSFICAQWIENCVDSHPNDLEGITACRSVICGARNASESSGSASPSSSTGAAPSATSSGSGESETPSETSASGSSASPSATDSAAFALRAASNYGSGVVVAGMLALFGLVL